MKVKDMMDLIGETIAELHAHPYNSKEFEGAIKKAEYEAKLAKQFFNGADITIRADKMVGRTDRTNEIV